MSTMLDPATGQPLPDSAIQRILFVAPTVHIYQIPPITSASGFSAASWTHPTHPTAQRIFSARLRVVETSTESTLKVDVVLEDGGSGELFAAAPYTGAAVVQAAQGSSRFFALRVVGERGMKATLGLGFEDRSAAFDFNLALGEARKVLGWDAARDGAAWRGGVGPRGRDERVGRKMDEGEDRDWRLKEGETITVRLGGRGGAATRRKMGREEEGQDSGAALFSIAPPPPPPASGKTDGGVGVTQSSALESLGKTAQELGFDDGEFGEFQ